MKTYLFIFFMILYNSILAQVKIIDSNCNCIYQGKLTYPIGDTGINGTVIIGFEKDSFGYFSNPMVIQSVGKNFDGEALRLIKDQILFLNRCLSKCKNKRKQTPNKYKQPITFTSPDE